MRNERFSRIRNQLKHNNKSNNSTPNTAASTRIIIKCHEQMDPPVLQYIVNVHNHGLLSVVHWRSYQQACEEYVPTHSDIAYLFLL